jgi:Mg-chelatase subunit ChlD
MDNSVANAQGKQEPKLAIAKRAAIDVCKSVAKYADEDKTRNIQLGLGNFSDDFQRIVAPAPPDVAALTSAINGMETRGGTAIGDAVQQAQKELDATHLKSQHILVITDGENNAGITPDDIATAISKLPADLQPTVYLIAFDTTADKFNALKAKGWQIFSASNGTQLQQQLDEVVGGHILIEK